MRAAVLLFTLVLLGQPLAMTGTASAATTDQVTLTVSVELADGTPVAGADLTAVWDGGSATATTASNGKAFIDVEEGADVNITMDHPDYTLNFPHQVADADERDVTIEVAPKASASITVEDADGPVEGATVRFTRNRRTVASDVTGSDGQASSGVIEEGTYRVAVIRSKYLTNRSDFEISGETSHVMKIERGFVSVEFSVVDPHFDPPKAVPDATISVKGVGTVNTQSNGIQQVSVPVNAKFDVVVSKDDYQQVRGIVRTRERDTSLTIQLRRAPNLSVEPFNRNIVVGERVSVRVTDEYDDPVSGATVYRNERNVGLTDENGEAVIEIPDTGEHRITAENGSISSAPVTVMGVSPDGSDETPVVTPTPSPSQATPTVTPTTTSPGQPGFGFVLPLVAGLLLGWGWRRKY